MVWPRFHVSPYRSGLMNHDRRILFLSKGADDASTRYRALQYVPLLQAAGWSAEHARVSRSAGDWLSLCRSAERADVVVVLRKLLPAPLCWLLRRCARRLVFDFDDAIFCRDTGEPAPGRMRRFCSLVRCADAVWAGNDYLAAAARDVRRNAAAGAVTMLPTAIDTQRYVAPRYDAGDPTLVWIGSRATRKYLEPMLPVLDELAAQKSQVRLKVIADFTPRSRRISVDTVPWSADTEATELARCHVGLAPLTDDSWTRGKCGCKVLQYMASGLPVVSSDMPAHRHLLGQNSALFAQADTEWTAAIASLLASSERRAEMGIAGRQRANQAFSTDVVSLIMLTSLDELTSSRRQAA